MEQIRGREERKRSDEGRENNKEYVTQRLGERNGREDENMRERKQDEQD